MAGRDVTLSIVSHRQNALVNQLLQDVQRHCADRVSLVLTENVPDAVPLQTGRLACPVEVIVNASGKGFGANHNAAFKRCRTKFFCVANPDIRLTADPFTRLVECLSRNDVGVAGPLVHGAAGNVEDSARRFPTAAVLAYRFFRSGLAPDYPIDRGPIEVDWIAGMFMLFGTDIYRAVSGFDEAYFMYYEDADICRRLRTAGKSVIYDPRAAVVHEARRESRKNPRLALHHLASATRFLWRKRAAPLRQPSGGRT